MILVRPYHDDDRDRLEALHRAQGLDYKLPDLRRMYGAVVEEAKVVTHAAFLRKTSEVYWLFDPATRKRDRAGRLLMLHQELQGLARRLRFEDVHCWVPPTIAKDFETTLFRLGWQKPLWTCYHREVG